MPYIKFYMTPGSCSTGIHILLEELGLIFEAYVINLLAGDQFKPEYLVINPRGSVPALVLEDGTALTSWQSIACRLAEAYPKARLLPENDDRARVMNVMDYAVNTMHGEGFARIFTTDRFALDEEDAMDELALGRRIVDKGFARLDALLEGRDYVAGQFSIADAALFYIEFWADRTDIPLPANCRAHYERMLQRPAVRQVLMEEGYARVLNG
ncbi:MAG TPA: glutathione S-transferase family protein [Mariprofundaceae bacterium]|nr:glutathione S-transferase family protein [Mariprofundaceae bacterium]